MDVAAVNRRRTNKLKLYLEQADKLHEAAEAVLDSGLTEVQAALAYGVTERYLNKKTVQLTLQRYFYQLHPNYTRAVSNVLGGIMTVDQAAVRFEVNSRILRQEIATVNRDDLENYSYNRRINYHDDEYWWYRDDEIVLQELKNWKMQASPDRRFTQIAIYEHISRLAYHHARTRITFYPNIWNRYRRTTVKWLIKFDMRHHDEIKDIFGDVEIE